MRYQCTNPECNFTFTHPSKYIENTFNYDPTLNKPVLFMHPGDFTVTSQFETCVCPNCHKINFTESVESASEVESVYIYELTTGPQTDLNKLLADGYVITNRYAKTYSLEKPKAKTVEDLTPEMKQAEAAYDKLDGA